MTKDPVCGMQVDETKASATSMSEGQRYVFCSQACKEKFDKNPQSYRHSPQQQQQHGRHEKVAH